MTAATLINHLPRLPKEPTEIITDGLKEGGGQFGKIGFFNRAGDVSLKLSCFIMGELWEYNYTIGDFERTLRGLLEYGTVSMNGGVKKLLKGGLHHE